MTATLEREPVGRVTGGGGGRSFATEALPCFQDVHRYACSLTGGNVFEADDLVQTTFFRAFSSWHTYRPDSECRRWLFTICRNAFLRGRERELRHDRCVESGVIDPALSGARRMDDVDDLLIRMDLHPAIAEALQSLPASFRAAVTLVDLEDRSYEDAAATLGVPLGTVRSRLFRGRRLLQQALVTHARDAGVVRGE